MSSFPRLRDLNPARLFGSVRSFSYQRLPNPSSDGAQSVPHPRDRWRLNGRMSRTKLIALGIGVFVVLAFVSTGGRYRHVGKQPEDSARPSFDEPVQYPWQEYLRLGGFFNGVRTLIPYTKFEPGNRYNLSVPPAILTPDVNELPSHPTLDPVLYYPYPDFENEDQSHLYHDSYECFLDQEEKIPGRDVYVYPGLPQDLPQPMYGSNEELKIRDDICFERFGRLGPYGYGYNKSHDGTGVGQETEMTGSHRIFEMAGFVNYTNIDWGVAQQRCFEKNRGRFEERDSGSKSRTTRQAYLLRAWQGYEFTDQQVLTIRAMVNELNIKSRGEYDVHILLHIKDDSIPIWADQGLYNQTLQANIPREFWNMTTLWSEQLMKMYYPGPFGDNFVNMVGSTIHGAYRSAHFAVQWFSQQHPEYDFVWNWEMDMRYTGHYYEFHSRVGEWARTQPRKGLWERSKRFWIPQHHGDYQNFTKFVEEQTTTTDTVQNDLERNGPIPIWGPVTDFKHNGMLAPPSNMTPPTSYVEDDYTWGVGEDADLITFNPIFDPSTTNWVFRDDATGYDRLLPIPPRRAAIITVARLSRRLLNIMHEETWRMKHHMFPEMWPSTMCLHHGLKAVYAPHPVYFDRDWNVQYMNQVFNYPERIIDTPFGWGEHNLLGSTFYYNAGFAGALWRRWLGVQEAGQGGKEAEENGSGRMCLRGTLLHPVKGEDGPTA